MQQSSTQILQSEKLAQAARRDVMRSSLETPLLCIHRQNVKIRPRIYFAGTSTNSAVPTCRRVLLLVVGVIVITFAVLS
jgi:hypothetical protein